MNVCEIENCNGKKIPIDELLYFDDNKIKSFSDKILVDFKKVNFSEIVEKIEKTNSEIEKIKNFTVPDDIDAKIEDNFNNIKSLKETIDNYEKELINNVSELNKKISRKIEKSNLETYFKNQNEYIEKKYFDKIIEIKKDIDEDISKINEFKNDINKDKKTFDKIEEFDNRIELNKEKIKNLENNNNEIKKDISDINEKTKKLNSDIDNVKKSVDENKNKSSFSNPDYDSGWFTVNRNGANISNPIGQNGIFIGFQKFPNGDIMQFGIFSSYKDDDGRDNDSGMFLVIKSNRLIVSVYRRSNDRDGYIAGLSDGVSYDTGQYSSIKIKIIGWKL